MTAWHTLAPTSAVEKLDSDSTSGLTSLAVEARQAEFGPNELIESPGRSPWLILWEQIRGAMVVLLFVAMGVSLVLGELPDAIVIFAIIVLNAILGFVQDYRAERALAALKQMAVPQVRVHRDGQAIQVSARELVPGDVIFLEAGNFVAADCRVIETANLKIEEAALTGESEPVDKQTGTIELENLPLGDRNNMAYMGTVVSYGHGLGVVTDIGMNTELGKIAHSLQTVDVEATPLQNRLAQFGRMLAVLAVAIVAIVFLLGLLRSEDPRLMLMTSLSLAVAIVPEGLPAVATVALAIGANRMFRRRALIRKLPAVETLGSVDVICSDKTGTLTQNQMTVTQVQLPNHHIDLPADLDGNHQDLQLLLACGALCNDAEITRSESDNRIVSVGDPTEGALVVAADAAGLSQTELQSQFVRFREVPFDSERKRMTTVHRIEPRRAAGQLASIVEQLAEVQFIAFSKGAPDRLLEVCESVWIDGSRQPLSDGWRDRLDDHNARLAAQGMRVLGLAMRSLDGSAATTTDPARLAELGGDDEAVESGLTFLGLVGLVDPPRPEVKEAVAKCRSAGIRPIMITGDHPLTASHIARRLDICRDGQVLVGQELEQMTDEELRAAVEKTSVYARVSPHDKLRLVQSLQDNGHIVAMTGDGVNDAPALKQAHIGVAMGITGTDVSKESAQMVLLDDNFATIVNAVEQGRIVYDNIRKFVKYTITSNTGEIWVMVLGPMLGMPLPLLPLQILWINLVTDGLPGLALATEGPERDTMNRPPYPPQETIFGRGMGIDVGWIGLLMGVVSLIMGYWIWRGGGYSDDSYWQTVVFSTLTFAQMGNALATRSSRDSLFSVGIFSNRLLIGSVVLTMLLQLLVIYWPPLQMVFKTTSLNVGDVILCIVISSAVFWCVELQKLVQRRRAVVEVSR